jgi:phosphoribosylamine--glycine ligase
VALVAQSDEAMLMDTFVRPALRHLASQGAEYRGVLYAGLMLTPAGPKLVEFNVRFGDPECQVVLPRLASDFAELVHAAAVGDPVGAAFSADACVTVVLAAEGYPASPRAGDVISGVAEVDAVNCVTVFHAGTARGPRDELITAGGRVLDVTATGADVAEARARAYDAVAGISWRGMQFRRDIAGGAVANEGVSGPGDGSAPLR